MVQGLSPVTTPLRLVLTWTKIVSLGSELAISGNPRLFLLLSGGDSVNSTDSPAKIYKSTFSGKSTPQSLGIKIIILDVTLASKLHRKMLSVRALLQHNLYRIFYILNSQRDVSPTKRKKNRIFVILIFE